MIVEPIYIVLLLLFALIIFLGWKSHNAVLNGLDSIVDLLEISHKRVLAVLDLNKLAEQNSRLSEENSKLREKQAEFKQFFGLTLDAIREDTTFMRSSLFKRLGAVDEYQEINHQIQLFQNRLDAIESTLREYRMIETYEDD